MTKEELARAIATGIIETGIEGDYGSVSCSTAGDYPSIGVSQWEGERANRLLESISGGAHYAYRSYYDLKYSYAIQGLKELLMIRQIRDFLFRKGSLQWMEFLTCA